MEKTIPWIGYQNFTARTSYIIEERTGLTVSKFKFASDGLDGVLNREFPIILVQDSVPCGSPMAIPKEISSAQYSAISQHIIRTIKNSEMGKRTPVVAIGLFMDDYNIPKTYLEAGADKFINLRRTLPSEACNEILRILGKESNL